MKEGMSKLTRFRTKLHETIFEAETSIGRLFDVALIANIVLSVIVVMLDSVAAIREEYGEILLGLEWIITIGFSIEYILRIYCIGNPFRYVTSFFGIVDLLAILPTYLSLFLPGSQYLGVVRVLRVVRIFRILKLANYVGESHRLVEALHGSRRKIEVFLFGVVISVIILGSLMYMIEGEENGFTSIPRSVYWAVVTMTTVGYGDISPKTDLGQFLAALVMIIGYCVLAVPTGIITAELTGIHTKDLSTKNCPDCSAEGHDGDAIYCKYCATKL